MKGVANPACPQCDGVGSFIGILGYTWYFRCVSCGWEMSVTRKPRKRKWKDLKKEGK